MENLKLKVLLLAVFSWIAITSCEQANSSLTIDEIVAKADTLPTHSDFFSEVSQFLISELNAEVEAINTDTIQGNTGIIEADEFYLRARNSTTILKRFRTERQAGLEFIRLLEIYACCIPDEDLAVLKRLGNVEHFKNNAYTFILKENVVVEISSNCYAELNELLKNKSYLKLEISNDGNAIWTNALSK